MIEVLVAATLFIIGAFATLAMLDNTVWATAKSKQRDVANALVQDIVERAHGLQYDDTVNLLTDIDAGNTVLPGPADRIQAALDPDHSQNSTPVVPATLPAPAIPRTTPQTWDVDRQGTTFTVSYYACTHSDTVNQVQIRGPFDCDRSPNDPGSDDRGTFNNCSIGVIPAQNVDPSDPGQLTARLQLLGTVGLNVCVGALSPDLSNALCDALSSSTLLNSVADTLLGTTGVITNLLGSALGSGLTVGLCPDQVEPELSAVQSAIASTTQVTIKVSWTPRTRSDSKTTSQTVLIRRPAT